LPEVWRSHPWNVSPGGCAPLPGHQGRFRALGSGCPYRGARPLPDGSAKDGAVRQAATPPCARSCSGF